MSVTTTGDPMSAITDELARCRFRYADEDELQAGLAAALSAKGFDVKREVRLDGRSRIDLLVGRVGIEVKIAGTAADVLRQLRRYAASDQIDGLVLVTSRVRHRMPRVLNGKPLDCVSIAGAGL